MPGGFPLGLEICNGISVGSTLTTTLPTLTNTTVINTKGAYTQLVGSTASDACFIIVDIFGWAATATSGSVDIAVGAAGSEQVIIADLVISNSFLSQASHYCFPVNIPAGTRLSARSQVNQTATNGIYVSVVLFDGAFTNNEGYAGVDGIGFVSGTSAGTSIDPGATANTKSAYVQLTASTARDYMGFAINTDIAGDTVSSVFPAWYLDISIGAAASEKDIVPNLYILGISAGASNVCAQDGPTAVIPIPIPSGTRISARAQCISNNASARKIGVVVYGVYQ